ncbi:hypothetical protein [Streptomyces buecherae]|uniref:WD40 repeat domain-containing protein n=1 Tax=Streptomyces buecherae TaxID=2763006 RepID=A0A7H8NJL4_9ACTN|nr:hypothetical protein [Streptomyces buecherae]QKW53598.1 hypothetical protein HUT08_33170 [Streptomyces buecherae]
MNPPLDPRPGPQTTATGAPHWEIELPASLPQNGYLFRATAAGDGLCAIELRPAGNHLLVARDADGTWSTVTELPYIGMTSWTVISATGLDNVWVSAGDAHTVWQWNGTAWSEHTVPDTDFYPRTYAVAAAGGRAWATTYRSSDSPAYSHFDGSQFTALPRLESNIWHIGTMTTDDAGNLWVAGDSIDGSSLCRWDGTDWKVWDMPDQLWARDVTVGSPDDVWVVGSANDGGSIGFDTTLSAHFDGTTYALVDAYSVDGVMTEVIFHQDRWLSLVTPQFDGMTYRIVAWTGSTWTNEAIPPVHPGWYISAYNLVLAGDTALVTGAEAEAEAKSQDDYRPYAARRDT